MTEAPNVQTRQDANGFVTSYSGGLPMIAQLAGPQSPISQKDTPMDQTLYECIDLYIQYLFDTGHRFQRVVATRRQLDYFFDWSINRQIRMIAELNIDDPLHYLAHLQNDRDIHTGEFIGILQRRERYTKLCRFVQWLYDKGHLDTNLVARVPKLDRSGNVTEKSATTTKTLSPC